MLAVLGAGLQTLDFNFEVALDPEEQPRSRDTSVQQSALLSKLLNSVTPLPSFGLYTG